MSRVLFRPGVPEDAGTIARLHVATWETAYRGLLPDDLLDGLNFLDRVPRWQRALADPDSIVYLAEIDGIPVGFLALGPCPDDRTGRTAELDAIYILAAASGQGIGSQFMALSDRWMIDQGYRRAVLWVLPTNAGARRFYERHGWIDDVAEKSLDVPGGSVPARRYKKPLETI